MWIWRDWKEPCLPHAYSMSCATNSIPDNVFTKEFDEIGDKVAQVVVRSRLVTCYELDLDNKTVNMSLFKNITGRDFVKVGDFMSKAVFSFGIATNGLPNIDRQPEFTSDAITRRRVCILTETDTADAPFEPGPNETTHKVDFLCACLYVRLQHQHLLPYHRSCLRCVGTSITSAEPGRGRQTIKRMTRLQGRCCHSVRAFVNNASQAERQM